MWQPEQDNSAVSDASGGLLSPVHLFQTPQKAIAQHVPVLLQQQSPWRIVVATQHAAGRWPSTFTAAADSFVLHMPFSHDLNDVIPAHIVQG